MAMVSRKASNTLLTVATIVVDAPIDAGLAHSDLDGMSLGRKLSCVDYS